MQYADTHVHIDSYEFPLEEIRACEKSDVVAVIATTRPSEFRRLYETYAGLETVRLGLGLHPEAAGSVYEPHELTIYEQQLDRTRWLSELGLDSVIAESAGSFFGSAPSLSIQTVMLERLLGFGVEGKVLSLHSRGAERQVLDMVRAAAPADAIFHWYRGDRPTAQQIANAGYFFSVNIDMIRDRKVHDFLRWVPSDLLLMETDGPFTAFDEGEISRPSKIERAVRALAEVRQQGAEELKDQLRRNFTGIDSTEEKNRES